MLQFNDLRADQRKKSYLRIRELNKVLSTMYLSLYTN